MVFYVFQAAKACSHHQATLGKNPRHQRYAAGASTSARDVNADGSQVGKSAWTTPANVPLIGNPYNGYIESYYWVDELTPFEMDIMGVYRPYLEDGLSGIVSSDRITPIYSLSQWPNFQFSGITGLVGKTKFKLLSQGPFAE